MAIAAYSITFLSSCGLVSGGGGIDYNEIVKDCKNKNVILMICDGCGFNQFASADFYTFGEKNQQPYYSFPIKYGISTHSLNANVYSPKSAKDSPVWVRTKFTDSGASATALATGVKTHNDRIGVDGNRNPVKNVTELAYETGRSAGIVTTMPISHATPGGFGAHIVSRSSYADIAREMITGTHLNVILGAGHPFYNNNGEAISNPEDVLDSNGQVITSGPYYNYLGGIDLFTQLKSGTAANLDGKWTYIETLNEFEHYASLSPDSLPDRLIGIAPVLYTLQSSRGSGPLPTDTIVNEHPKLTTVPSLKMLSKIALQLLSKNENGFFLMIEGGAIDAAAHQNSIARAIEEMIDFNIAVEEVTTWIEANGGFEDNLLIITADHETGFLIGPNGYTEKTIDYELISNGIGNIPGHSWNSGSHTNQLVPLFAKGECSEAISETIQGTDQRHGAFTDNAVLGKLIHHILLNSNDSK